MFWGSLQDGGGMNLNMTSSPVSRGRNLDYGQRRSLVRLWFDSTERTWIDLSKNPRVSLPCLVPLSKAPYSPNLCSPSAVHGRSLLCVSCTRWPFGHGSMALMLGGRLVPGPRAPGPDPLRVEVVLGPVLPVYRRANIQNLTQAACVWTVGRELEPPEKTHADTSPAQPSGSRCEANHCTTVPPAAGGCCNSGHHSSIRLENGPQG
ncbi:unnamed protein product [Pleuronectes platessa]|uniref:Uncharacterized protein n=1 Tax=Pleuronectes platessa TaxID=8262 RepID=A0A9N7Z8Z0_PLEPL|nr:unnamed protein product [Pleuronectes platessa]